MKYIVRKRVLKAVALEKKRLEEEKRKKGKIVGVLRMADICE